MSKLQELIRELCPNGVEYKKLGEIADYPKERTSIKEIDCYVGVENLLKDKQGVCKSKIMPNSESAILRTLNCNDAVSTDVLISVGKLS